MKKEKKVFFVDTYFVLFSDRVGFEPTVLAYTSFQDWHLQPLRHPSSAREWDLNPQCSDYEPDELPITLSRDLGMAGFEPATSKLKA